MSPVDDWLVSVPAKNETVPFRWRRAEGGVVAEWVGVLRVHVDASGRPSFTTANGANEQLAAKLKNTAAMAFVRALRGLPSLHGSAVAKSGNAIVCIGDSGAGKSTVAAALCSIGFELLADDVVALELIDGCWIVHPTEEVHWLEDASAKKGPRKAERVATRPAALKAIASLRVDSSMTAPSMARLHGARVYGALSAATLRFDATDDVRRRELNVLGAIGEQASVFEVLRPPRSRPSDVARVLGRLLESAP